MAQLVRAFTSNVPVGTAPPITDVSFPPGTPVRVNIEAEAKAAELTAGTEFAVGGTVINRNTGVVAALVPVGTTPANGVDANMATAFWPAAEANRRFEYEIPGAFALANQICEVIAFLRVGAVAPYTAEFATTYWMRTPA